VDGRPRAAVAAASVAVERGGTGAIAIADVNAIADVVADVDGLLVGAVEVEVEVGLVNDQRLDAIASTRSTRRHFRRAVDSLTAVVVAKPATETMRCALPSDRVEPIACCRDTIANPTSTSTATATAPTRRPFGSASAIASTFAIADVNAIADVVALTPSAPTSRTKAT
jgi:hypothetical protein